MISKSEMEYSVYFVIPSMIFVFGLFGNILGLVVLKCKKLKKIGPVYIYRFLFITDTVYLLSILKTNVEVLYNVDLLVTSYLWCKFFTYCLNAVASIPPMLLVYISIERFLSIKHIEKSHFLKNKNSQYAYFVCVVCFNFVFYFPVLIIYDLNETPVQYNNMTIIEKMCTFADSGNILFGMIFTNRIFLPFLLMFTATVLLIHTIFRSRTRIQSNYTFRENLRFRKDVKFAFTSITINIMFIILNLPFILVYFLFKFEMIMLVLTLNLFLISYAINFYLILISNFLFRKEFFLLFVSKKYRFYYEAANQNQTTMV